MAYVVALGVAALAGAFGLRRLWRAPWLRRALLATDQSTSQLRVRGAFVILLAFAQCWRKCSAWMPCSGPSSGAWC
ncbi:MAG: hypothetical protein ACRDOK_23185 [Streptosporangiaceae bacterium]